MLQAHSVTKVYGSGVKELRVLDGIDLDIRQGETLGIVGPSGAGKSTLLHILGALDEPTGGDVVWDGQQMSRLSDSQRARIRNERFGFVFQFYHLMQEFSALENVMMPALLSATRPTGREVRAKAAGLLESLKLGGRLHHRPGELSGGEQQRVAIARALMNDPDILFCDEPTGNLDYESGRQVRDMLFGLNRDRQMTLVVVTHSRELVEGAHRLVHLLDGRIVSQQEKEPQVLGSKDRQRF